MDSVVLLFCFADVMYAHMILKYSPFYFNEAFDTLISLG